VNYTVQAAAKLQKKTLPVCILIMEETDKHTLFALGDSKIHFDQCIVQVDTVNWDAVEGRGNGEIVSTNGQHCFNGEIHRGKVLPPRADINSCTFFPDPFTSKEVPAADLACDFNDVVVTTAQTLEAGTYCGGLEISANVTFKEGLVVIKDGPFTIKGGSTQVNAPKNTIALVGPSAVLDFNAGTDAKLSIQAPKDGEVGPLDGFAIFADQAALAGAKKDPKSSIVNTNIDMAGILYLRRHELEINGSAQFTAKPGAIVTDYLITDGKAFVDLHALPMGSTGYTEMLKVIDDVATPVLIK
jgi:hypothetical protein